MYMDYVEYAGTILAVIHRHPEYSRKALNSDN